MIFGTCIYIRERMDRDGVFHTAWTDAQSIGDITETYHESSSILDEEVELLCYS